MAVIYNKLISPNKKLCLTTNSKIALTIKLPTSSPKMVLPKRMLMDSPTTRRMVTTTKFLGSGPLRTSSSLRQKPWRTSLAFIPLETRQ